MKAERADEHLRWLRAVVKLGHQRDLVATLPAFGALTGTDYRALSAIDRCWELYSSTGSKEVFTAIATLVMVMQPHTRPFARALIARSMDWGDVDRLWPCAHCPPGDSEHVREVAV